MSPAWHCAGMYTATLTLIIFVRVCSWRFQYKYFLVVVNFFLFCSNKKIRAYGFKFNSFNSDIHTYVVSTEMHVTALWQLTKWNESPGENGSILYNQFLFLYFKFRFIFYRETLNTILSDAYVQHGIIVIVLLLFNYCSIRKHIK